MKVGDLVCFDDILPGTKYRWIADHKNEETYLDRIKKEDGLAYSLRNKTCLGGPDFHDNGPQYIILELPYTGDIIE